MGTTATTNYDVTTTLADALFTPVQQRVLGLLFGQPGRRFQSVELIRMADSGTGATHRLLKRLADSGLVRASVEGRQKYYQANPESPVFDELVGLVRKTVGLADVLKEALAGLNRRIALALVFGSVARGEEGPRSDVDVLLVGEIGFAEAVAALHEAQSRIGREINPVVLSRAEFRKKARAGDTFLVEVLGKEKLFLMGDEHDLGRLVGHPAPGSP